MCTRPTGSFEADLSFPKQSLTQLSLSRPVTIMEEDQLLNGPISATFTFPLTHYPSHLFSGDHRIFLSDCGGERSNDKDEDGGRSFFGEGCAYSKPILVRDVVWNMAFVLVSIVVLLSTVHFGFVGLGRGYGLQCILHVGFVYFDYGRRGFADLLGFAGLYLSHRRTR